MKPLTLDPNGNPTPCLRASQTATTIKVDGTAASAQSAVISATAMSIVRIAADSDCYILTGANPTALNNGTCQKLYAKTYTDLLIDPSCKIAVIGGIIYITPHA